MTASPRVAATGAIATVRLAGGGANTHYYRGGEHYRAGIVDRPRFKAALGFDQNGWTGGTVPTAGNLLFKPADPRLVDELAAYHWKDAPLLIESGPEGGPYSTLLSCTVADVQAAEIGLVFQIEDLSLAIGKPLLTGRFAGTGGNEGGAEAAGRVKRRSWGRVFNVEGRVFDKAYNLYEFGDPAFPAQAFDALRDVGRSAAPAPAILAWQGSIAATIAALRASAPVGGSGVGAPSIQMAKWWMQPKLLTADLRGEIGTGYVETAPEIAARICAAANGPAIANVSAMAALRAGVAGLHVDDDRETAAQALDRLLLGVSLLWILEPAGTIRLREWTFTGSPVATVRAASATRKRVFAPVKSRRLGYQRSYRTHNEGEIAASLLQLDPTSGAKLDGIAPGAGTTIDLDPAFVGTATNVGNRTTGIAYGGGGGTLNILVKTKQRWKGPVIAAGQVTGTTSAVGITKANAPAGLADIDFFLYWDGANCKILTGVSLAQSFPFSFAAGDTLAVGQNEAEAVFLVNGVEVGTRIPLAAGQVGQSWRAIFSPNIPQAGVPQSVTGDLEPWDVKSEVNADVTYEIVGPSSAEVVSKADGTFDTGVLAAAAQSYRTITKAGDVTTSLTYGVSAITGSGTATIAISNGKAVLTPTALPETTIFEIAASLAGTVRDKHHLTMVKRQAQAASGSSGSGNGTSDSKPVGGWSNSTTPTALCPVIKVKAGALGKISCTMNLGYVRQETTSGGAAAAAVWKWRAIGGVFADIAAAVVGDAATTIAGDPQEPGGLTCAMEKTGLTDGTEYELQPYGWRNSGTGTLSFYGQGGSSAACSGT